MKKVIYLLIAVLGATSGFAQTKAPLEFKESKFSFGKVKQGVPVTHTFTFTNTSDKPVIIENATASCGCTTPEYPKAPISPGASNKISVTYNAAAMGTFTKPVTVKIANLQDPIMLNIEGEVVDATAASKPAAAEKSTAAAKTKVKATPAKTKTKSKS
jgi:hypothetical protein